MCDPAPISENLTCEKRGQAFKLKKEGATLRASPSKCVINALILIPHPSKVPPILLDKQFSDFTPDITPIILAAHTNNYEIIKLLVQKGVSMPQPHEVGELVCICVLKLCVCSVSPNIIAPLQM